VARTGARGGQRVSTHPLSRFVTLRAPSLRPAPCWSWLWTPLEMCVCFLFCVCLVRLRCVVTRTPVTPAERRVGRTALMTMPSRYVGIEHVSIRFTAPHARAPLGSWSTWSPRVVVTRCTSFPASLLPAVPPPPPPPPTCCAGRTPLRPGAQPAVNNSQGQSACFAVPRALLCVVCGAVCGVWCCLWDCGLACVCVRVCVTEYG
jgi:hypothetical protein